jgi:hypothetical protein
MVVPSQASQLSPSAEAAVLIVMDIVNARMNARTFFMLSFPIIPMIMTCFFRFYCI